MLVDVGLSLSSIEEDSSWVKSMVSIKAGSSAIGISWGWASGESGLTASSCGLAKTNERQVTRMNHLMFLWLAIKVNWTKQWMNPTWHERNSTFVSCHCPQLENHFLSLGKIATNFPTKIRHGMFPHEGRIRASKPNSMGLIAFLRGYDHDFKIKKYQAWTKQRIKNDK